MHSSEDILDALYRLGKRVNDLEGREDFVEILGEVASMDKIVHMKITGLHTDSPASGVRMYSGDIYGSGTLADATETGVTVRIPDIAADVELPSCGAWASVPPCCGVRTTLTWTGATTTHTSDTVYEAIGLLLIV